MARLFSRFSYLVLFAAILVSLGPVLEDAAGAPWQRSVARALVAVGTVLSAWLAKSPIAPGAQPFRLRPRAGGSGPIIGGGLALVLAVGLFAGGCSTAGQTPAQAAWATYGQALETAAKVHAVTVEEAGFLVGLGTLSEEQGATAEAIGVRAESALRIGKRAAVTYLALKTDDTGRALAEAYAAVLDVLAELTRAAVPSPSPVAPGGGHGP